MRRTILNLLVALLLIPTWSGPLPAQERLEPKGTIPGHDSLRPRLEESRSLRDANPLSEAPDSVLSKGEQSQQLTEPSERKGEDKAPNKPEAAKSTIENYFSRSGPPIGAAIGGATPIRAPQSDRQLLEQQEQDAIYSRLLVESDDLTLAARTVLFRELDQDRQSRYLQSLAPEAREEFLRALGDSARWYPADLTTVDVDRNLQQFGYAFFDQPGRVAPDHLAAVGPDYVVGPGDTLVISLWGSIDGTFEVPVDRSGSIVLPRIGSVQVWGQTFSEARESIRRQISKNFTNFEFNLSLGELRSIQVYLVGEVATPGTYTLSSVATVLNALAAAGGPARGGSLRQVQLVRNGQTSTVIDFYDFLLNGDRSRDARLQSGDTIYVPVVGALVGIAGEVRRPAIYELKSGETLPDLLRMAGGLTSTAFLKRIQVERVEAHRQKVTLDLDLTDSLGEPMKTAFRPQDRDLILVTSISPANTSYVLLKGYVAHPGRYQFHSGMRLADLIVPNDNLLPDYFPRLAEILRLQPPLYRPEKLTVNLMRALEGDAENNLLLQEFDEVRLFARDEMEELQQVTVSGGITNPGDYRFFDRMTVRDLIVAAGNVKRGAYLEEAELSRHTPAGTETRSERILFNLQRALEGDPVENLLLQPEDQLFVRSIPDYSERLSVEVKGQLLFPGNYSISRGELLSEVLERAGGFVAGAYLRGATFSRETVREVQQKRLEQLILEQEQQIARAASDIALGALSTEELQSAQTLLTSRKALLEKLRQMPANGRMVVHLLPLDRFKNSTYDIPLMDGDVITIPDNPKSVSVLGQVYNPTTMVYQEGKTVSYYLNKVGGSTENANAGEMFVVRADGTVFSKQQSGSGIKWDDESRRWFSGGFSSTELYPGDTLLVPEKVKKVDIMREVKDLTTILYQMALGAAAVASF